MTRDEYADRLAEVAAELVVRVRDEGPDDNAAWLRTALPNPAEREHLLYVLAAAVPDDQSWLALTSWTTGGRKVGPQPCGTAAAAKRHRANDEQPCVKCEVAEREDWRLRKQEQRARKNTKCTTRRTKETRAA